VQWSRTDRGIGRPVDSERADAGVSGRLTVMRPGTPIPPELLSRPFRRREADDLGLSRRVLQGRRFVRLFDDVYAVMEIADDPLIRAKAVQLANPGAALSHDSAAGHYGLPLPRRVGSHVTVPRGRLRSITPIPPSGDRTRVHETRQPETWTYDGWLVTLPERTLTDLGQTFGLLDLVAVGDALVRRELTTPEALIDAAQAARRPGVRAARRSAALVRPRVDSATETRLRLLTVLAGLPEPETGRDIYDGHGAWIARPDLSYPKLRIAIEYDGRHHAESGRQWAKDIGRREHYDRSDWRLIVVTSHHLYRQPGPTIMRILELLHERGHPQAPAMPSTAWRAYF
jgi:hypothetical protein